MAAHTYETTVSPALAIALGITQAPAPEGAPAKEPSRFFTEVIVPRAQAREVNRTAARLAREAGFSASGAEWDYARRMLRAGWTEAEVRKGLSYC